MHCFLISISSNIDKVPYTHTWNAIVMSGLSQLVMPCQFVPPYLVGLNGGKSKLKEYFSHIHFYLNYANIAWESTHVRKSNKIHTQQKTCCLCCPQ